MRNKIDEVLDDPDTQVGTRKRDGAKGYLGPDGTLVIHNPIDSHYFFDEWTNDLYGRAEIQKIFLACEIPEEIRQRLEAIDEIYRQKTIPLSDIGVTNFCLEQDWDKENYWFAYRIPPERWENWKEYYKDPIYFYEKEE